MNKFIKWWAKFTGKYIAPDGKVYSSKESYLYYLIDHKHAQLVGKSALAQQLANENASLRAENLELKEKLKEK